MSVFSGGADYSGVGGEEVCSAYEAAADAGPHHWAPHGQELPSEEECGVPPHCFPQAKSFCRQGESALNGWLLFIVFRFHDS